MRTLRLPILPALTLLLLSLCQAAAASDGRAIVRVELEPAASGTLGFEGTPAGRVQVPASGVATLEAAVAAGSHASRLVFVDPALSSYQLASVRCDDAASASPSRGDPAGREASFAVEAGETVTCTFVLRPQMACTCPREGRWQASNHPGTMACTGGPIPLSMPLAPSRQTSTLTPNADCSSVLAEGMGDDEADIEMHRQPDCSWVGSLDIGSGQIPAQIDFRWTVMDDGRRIEGELSSRFAEQGMVCTVERGFSLESGG